MSERRPDARHQAVDPAAGTSGALGARRADDSISTADLTYHELRDALWLSGKLRPRVNERESVSPGELVASAETTDDPLPAESVQEEADRPEEVREEPEPVSRTGFSSLAARTDVFRLDWPTLLALPEARGIARALRPFMRTTSSPWRSVLDEEGTAVRAAEDGLWLPEGSRDPGAGSTSHW